MSFRKILAIPGTVPVLFTQFMTSFGFGVILPVLPFYALSLGITPFELGALTASFALASLVFGPVMGKLSDRFGKRNTLLAGTAGFVVTFLMMAFAPNREILFLSRALQGIFSAAVFPACTTLLSDYTNEKDRGHAMGLLGIAFSIGFIVGPAVGGFAATFSVRDAFIVSAALAALNFGAVFMQVREPGREGQKADTLEKEISMLEHVKSPMLFQFMAMFMIAFMLGGLDATLAIYTSEKMGFSSAQMGLVFTYIGVLILAMQAASASLINRFGEERLIKLGLGLSGLGFFLLTFTHDWLTLLGPLAVFVAGNAMVTPSTQSLITKRVQRNRGAVLGISFSFRSLGQMVGPLLAGFLYGFHHDYAFLGLAVVIWAYAAVLVLADRKN